MYLMIYGLIFAVQQVNCLVNFYKRLGNLVSTAHWRLPGTSVLHPPPFSGAPQCIKTGLCEEKICETKENSDNKETVECELKENL